MKLSVIAAVARNGVIGKGGRLPWHLPADLKRFKTLTLGHPVIMGRRTFESIGKPLPGRTNIVVTHERDLKICGCLVAPSFEKALELCNQAEEAFVLGGASLYEQALPRADRLYLTRIHADFEGDARMPPLDLSRWKEISREDFLSEPLPYSFITYGGRSTLGHTGCGGVSQSGASPHR